jgi:hypothetical protein
MGQTRSSVHSRAAKARWADPATGAKIRAAIRDPCSLAKMREASKARWADPLMREKMITAMRAAGARTRANVQSSGPEMRERRIAVMKARWADPLMREKMIAGMRVAGARRRKRDTDES